MGDARSMKRVMVGVLFFFVLLCRVAAAENAVAPKSQAAAPSAASQPADDKAAKKAAAETRLKDTQWAITLSSMDGEPSKKPLTDTLSFKAGTIASERLTSDGYPTTHYTLTIQDNGVPVWETMQSQEGKGVAFWRGELHGDTIRGILSEHPDKGKVKDYSFSGKQATVAPPAPAAAPAQPAAAMTQPTAASPAQAAPSGSTQVSAQQPAASTTPPAPSESPKKRKRKLW